MPSNILVKAWPSATETAQQAGRPLLKMLNVRFHN